MSKTKRLGWIARYTFSNDFTALLNKMHRKYGEEIFDILGISNDHLDIANFSRQFFGTSNNIATVSADSNANVRDKTMVQYVHEARKATMILNSLYVLYKAVKDNYTKKDACDAIEAIISGQIFVNDLSNANTFYCYSFDLRNLLMNGMSFYKGNLKINPPHRSDSFIALLIQTTAHISNEIMGAVGYSDFFIVLDYFYRKEMGDDYLSKWNKEEFAAEKKSILDQFQNLIYSFNFNFRGAQSSFVTLSVMDKGFLESLFGEQSGYIFPDMTKPNLSSTQELSEHFFEYFSDINGKESIFTFPVITLAISVDEKNKYIDPNFVNWVAGANCKKALGNIYQGPASSLSNCCRLRSELIKDNEIGGAGYSNSFGVGGISIGSCRIAGMNMPRIAIMEKEYPNIFQDTLNLIHKLLYSHRHIMREKSKFISLYESGWASLSRQYSTVGMLGAYEYVRNSGYDIQTQEGINFLLSKFNIIEDNIKQWQIDEKSESNIYNIESIPGESMAVKLASIDNILGYNDEYEMYSNQYIPLTENVPIYDRFHIQGQIDKKTSGGAILHLNVDDEKPLTKKQMLSIIKMAKDSGTVYFAINYAFSECANRHYNIGKVDKCAVCDANIVEQYTRVVGFLVPVSAWSKVRKDYEYPKRVFYGKDRIGE